MKEFNYTITDPEGIHARPAGLLVKKANEYTSKVTICINGREADAKRIFAIMGLGVKKDMTITVKAEGDDEQAAIAGIGEFLKENL